MVMIITLAYAQDTGRVETRTQIYQASFTKIGSESWGYGGIDVVGSDSTLFPFSNPALMPAQHFTATVELTKVTNTSGPLIFNWDDPYIIPSYAVLQFPLKGLNMAAGYANYYDLQLYLEPIPISTIQQPGGTGDFFDAEINVKLHTFFGAFRYNPHPKLSVGVTMGANYLKRLERVSFLEAKGSGWGWQSVVGMSYTTDQNLTFGASFRYLNDINYTVEISTNDLLVSDLDPGPGGSNDKLNASLQQEISWADRFPWELKIGLSYKFYNRFQFFSMINFQDWSRVNSSDTDQQQFHLGLQAAVYSETKLSLGFYTQWEADERESSIAKYLNQNFITFGLSQKLFNKYKFNISFMDSRIYSNPDVERDFGKDADEFHQTKIVVGLQYNFI